jgi:hypothetical protein
MADFINMKGIDDEDFVHQYADAAGPYFGEAGGGAQR